MVVSSRTHASPRTKCVVAGGRGTAVKDCSQQLRAMSILDKRTSRLPKKAHQGKVGDVLTGQLLLHFHKGRDLRTVVPLKPFDAQDTVL